MTRPTTYNVSELLAAMGVKGGLQPELSDGPLIPTVQVADFTRGIVSELVEGRGVATLQVANTLNDNYPVVLFVANSGGGVIIESYQYELIQLGTGTPLPTTNAPAGAMVLHDSDQAGARLGLANETAAAVLEVGGKPTTSILSFGERFTFATTPFVFGTSFTLAPGERWYLPSGRAFGFQTNSRGATAGSAAIARHTFTWREIGRIQGAA